MGGQRRFAAERCPDCGLHPQLCACAERPSLELRTRVLVVQNNHERHKPTNTARLLPQVLRNAELVWHGERDVAFDESVLTQPESEYLLMFPRVHDPEGPTPIPAPMLDAERAASLRASAGKQLTVVLLDGTWAQCSRMSRRVAALAHMPAYVLAEGPPGHWGVRKASHPSRISTYEAAIRVIELLEGPEPALALQVYFDRVAAAMLYMKGKLPAPEVPAAWLAERERRFASPSRSSGTRLRADFRRREVVLPPSAGERAEQRWSPSPAAGVDRWMLDRIGDEVARATSIVRYAPDSSFPAHVHGGGEEFLVLEGVFGDEHGSYAAGSYVRNPIGSSHAPWAGPEGATLFVKLRQFDARDQARVCIDTRAAAWTPTAEPGVEKLPLHVFERERVSLFRFAPGSRLPAHDHPGGEELLVLEGELSDEHGSYAAGTWIRNPAGFVHAVHSEGGALLYAKTGHLS